MWQNLLHKMKEVCGVTSHMVKDELTVGIIKWTEPGFNLCFATLASQVRCYCILFLLSFIATMYWTKFLYELYSNNCVLIHYIEGHLFCVSIIGCHTCLYSAISIVFCTFKFSSMTLSLSLSLLLHVHWILFYRIKNISFMVFIKQLKPSIFVQCKYVAIQTGALPFKVRVVGSIPLIGTGIFCFLSFSPFLSLLSLH